MKKEKIRVCVNLSQTLVGKIRVCAMSVGGGDATTIIYDRVIVGNHEKWLEEMKKVKRGELVLWVETCLLLRWRMCRWWVFLSCACISGIRRLVC